MLSKKFRLPLPSTLSTLKKNGISRRGQHITIISYPNHLTHPRVGIIISKKISPSAVVRNKLKRTITAILGEWLKTHSPSTDFLIVPRKHSHTASFTDIHTDLHATLTP